MKKLTATALLGGATLALAACGSSESASTDAEPEKVEMPANEPLQPVTEEPVEDPNANAETGAEEEVEGPAPVTQEDAQSAADTAEGVAAQAEEAERLLEQAEAADNAANSALEAIENE